MPETNYSTETAQLYDRIARNCDQAADALAQLIPLTQNPVMRSEMQSQEKVYRSFRRQARAGVKRMGGEPSQPGMLGRMWMDAGIQVKARTDPSDRNLAQMLAEGSSQGVTGCVMARRDCTAASDDARLLAEKLERFEQSAEKKWREFL